MRNGKREAQMRTNGKREAQMRANVETRNGKRECTSGPPYPSVRETALASPSDTPSSGVQYLAIRMRIESSRFI